MAANYGAHEILDMHEVLEATINDINTMQLYRPHVKDQQLASIMDKQMQFSVQGYNLLVNTLNHTGNQQAIPYRAPKMTSPTYGLRQPAPVSPNMSVNEIDDRDISSALLQLHKVSAVEKMRAAQEAADPHIRGTLQQASVNCSEQAYEVWQYMNQRGYYQVPTMKDVTTSTMMGIYQPTAGGAQMTMGTMNTAGLGTSGMGMGQANSYQTAISTANYGAGNYGTQAGSPSLASSVQSPVMNQVGQGTVGGVPSTTINGQTYDVRHTASNGIVSPAALVFRGNISSDAMASLNQYDNQYNPSTQYSAQNQAVTSHTVDNQTSGTRYNRSLT
ncbi:spore coat protein [Brevibacillus dissolubilis]|uniref:spore coat protein n=1 Tax=Brevibacillus dissolubilis TaxID=1844116 RepID=UPI0011164EC1|nr:spore coat protein [Brevibacillus dissolubilis]